MISIYVAILSFNAYIEQYKVPPTIDDFHEFISVYRSKVLKSNAATSTTTPRSQIQPSTLDVFKEILMHNSTNYPNLSSLMGGVASQEILKLTTAQYIPLDNLFIFDGIKSSSERFKIQ